MTLGDHLELTHAEGRWTIRAQELLGYESLQVEIGVESGRLADIGLVTERSAALSQRLAALTTAERIGLILFAASLVVYAITRFISLDQFPINFFADEANQVLVAMNLVKQGLRDPQSGWLPIYFHLNAFYYPDIAVYFHAITASLLGQSIVVTRGTSVLVTLFAAGAVGLTMRVFNARYWWTATLLLAVVPAWFLFSRTAFDFVTMSSFYALFILFYLLYRYRSPRYIYPALLVGAVTFYAYPIGQAAISALAVFLFISDLRYHWQQRRILPWVVLLVAVVAIPFIRFALAFPDESVYHLHALNSYWTQNIPLADKVTRWVSLALNMLSPGYWFMPNQPDLMRHEMKGYGFLPWIDLPLLLIGLVISLRHFRESKYRTLLAALVVVPISAAVTDIAIIRVLAFVIPATIVSALGLEWLLTRIRNTQAALVTSLAVSVILIGLSVAMLQDALTNGPTWYTNYGLYGMQWGAKQLYQDTVPDLMATNPGATIYVSDTWANASDLYPRFFGFDPDLVKVSNIGGWMQKKLPLDPKTVFIMTADEYTAASKSNKFKSVDVQETIPYPNGDTGFYVAQVAYADNVDSIFAAERAAQLQPVTDTVTLAGEIVQVTHTKFDIGTAQSMFDGDPYTVARGIEANPLELSIKFPSPQALHSLTAHFGAANVRVKARLYAGDSAQPVEYTADFQNAANPTGAISGPAAQMNFDGAPDTITRLDLEITVLNGDANAHVHIFELGFH